MPKPFRVELYGDQILVGDHLPGTSPGYLFLHGLGSVRAGEKSDSLLQHAARRGRAFTRWDFRGHGESTGIIGQVTIGELIDDTVRILERYGPKIVVGSSLGGLVAAFAIARRPELATCLALIAPAFGFLHRLDRSMDEQGRMWTSDGRGFPIADRVLDDAKQLDERDVPGRIPVPTLMIHGDADEIVSHRRSERFFAAIPHQRKQLWIVEGGDHRLSDIADQMWTRLDALIAGDDR